MKSVKIYLPILFFVFTISFAQTKINIQRAEESNTTSQESYPVDAGPLLERFNRANGIDLNNITPIPQQLKKVAWNFDVGSPATWWASDLRTNASPSFYQISSTCRAVGTNCYVFVQDSLWTSRVDQNAVDSVRIAFDLKTPSGSINPSQGIYQNVVDTYGSPPNLDSDSKIIILILDIRDGYKGTGGYTAGYFHGYNEGNGTYSNRAEIYYLDGNPLNLKATGGLTTGMSTTAHEFQHMVQFNYHGLTSPSQEPFFNEGCSLVAEVINGYPLFSQSSYYNVSTNRNLLDWNPNNDATDVLKDYSRAARFFLYLKEQFGVGVLKSFTQAPITGVNALNNYALPAVPTTRQFNDIVVDWWIANYLNDKTVAPGLTKWGYDYPNVPKVSANTILNPNISYSSDAVYKFGAQYINFTAGKNLNIIFNNPSFHNIKVMAIKTGTSDKEVKTVTPGTNYSFPDFGTTYNNIAFVVYNNDQNESTTGPFPYSYTSSGIYENNPVEIAYDNTEPVGFISLLAGDSVAVNFDAVPNGRLDSIRVAIRNLTPINGRVLEYLGLTNKLGGQLYANFTATSNLSESPQVINQGGEYPYEQPYPNWTKVDLRSFNISTDKNFVVEFPYEDPYPGKNRVLATYAPSTGVEHSIIYRASTSSWGYSGVSGKTDYSWAVLIRAYVSDKTTGVEKVIELMPSSFSLNQNYPNPFNPSTVISYQLPVAGHVSLKVFDLLGREVATLVDEFQQAGNHNSQFSTLPTGRQVLNSQLSSGIYFYTLRAGNYLETKKMLLLK